MNIATVITWVVTVAIFILTQVLTSIRVSSKYFAQVENLKEEIKQIVDKLNSLDSIYVRADMCEMKHSSYDTMLLKMTEMSESVAKLTASNEHILSSIQELKREVRNGKPR